MSHICVLTAFKSDPTTYTYKGVKHAHGSFYELLGVLQYTISSILPDE